MSQRPAPPQPLQADKSGGDRSFDRWLFLFYAWLKKLLQGVVDAASGNVFYSDGAGNITSEAAFNYNATTNALAVGSVSATTTLTAGTTVTAGTGITSTTGNIVASAGNITATLGAMSAGTTVTAGTGITATTGNITATAGNFVLTAGYLDLNEIADPGFATANHAWLHAEDVAGITQVHHNTATHKWAVGQDNWIVARNTSGGIIGQLKAVYVTGSTGARPEIALADADLHHHAIGITQDSMANNAYGVVVLAGYVKGVDTSAWTAGDGLYVSSTAGDLVTTPPALPAGSQRLATVIYSHATNGIVLVFHHEDTRESDGTWNTPFLFHHTATEADDHAVEIYADAAGFSDVKGLDIVYTTGAAASTSDEEAILIQFVETASLGADLAGIEVLATGEGTVGAISGLKVGAGVGPISQLSGSFANAASILNKAVSVLTELSTGGAGNITMFVADNDTITIGSAAKFEEIEFILDIAASGSGIAPTFEYSTGVGTWGTFGPADGTNGFRNSGIVAWSDSDIPSWATGTGSEYLVRITRTRNTLTTSPRCDKVQIVSAAEYLWDKDGLLKIKTLRLQEPVASGTNYSEFVAQAQAGNITYTLPAANATNGVLLNNGSGTLTWDTNISDLIDHGTTTGLSDDDHSQYVLNSGARTGVILAVGSGDFLQIGGGVNASAIRFMEPSGSGTNYTAFKAQAQAGNVTYTLPAADATVNGYALKSDGSGNLSWGAAGGEELKRNIAQTAHGFSVGNPVYYNGTIYVKADCTTEAAAEVVGIVSVVIDVDNFTLVYGGYITGLSGLTAGSVHFLSSTAGALTTTEPTTSGYISKPLLIANSTTTGYFFNMRGQEIGGGVAGVREITSGTATAGQTSISAVYTPGYVDVYVNGVRLLADDYVATSGTAIVLDTGMAVNDEWVVVVWQVVALAQIVAPTVPGGRLTLATATPVMATEQAAKQTVYYTPYVGDLIPIYDGTAWNMKRFAELSMAMAGSANWAANSNYDLYVYNDGGTLRLGTGAAWTSATARNESLTLLNGIYVNAATMTLRYGASSTVSVAANRATYVGTMRTTANTGETTWEIGGRALLGDEVRFFVWNLYNRVLAVGCSVDTTDSWTYGSATVRSLNASTANRLSFVRGFDLDPIEARNVRPVVGTGDNTMFGFGLDVTNAHSVPPAGFLVWAAGTTTTFSVMTESLYAGSVSLGYHFLQGTENIAAGVATNTHYGDLGLASPSGAGCFFKGMF